MDSEGKQIADGSNDRPFVIERDEEAAAEPMPAAQPRHPEPAPPAAEPPARPIPTEYLLLFLPTLVFLCYLLVPIYLRIDAAARYPFELDGEEGFVFYDAVQLRLGKPIYHSIDDEPYVVGNYPPVFPWIVSKMLNPQAMGLTTARLVVALSSILITQLLILIVFLRTRRLVPSFLAPLLFLVTYEFHDWSAYSRVDLPALAFTLLGLAIFLAGERRWTAAASAAVFVLAAFTRVTAILAPAACCLSMLLWDRRRLAWFLIPYLGLGLGLWPSSIRGPGANSSRMSSATIRTR